MCVASQPTHEPPSYGLQGDECGVLLWDHTSATENIGAWMPCAAPLARIFQPNEPATCVAVSAPPPPDVAAAAAASADGSSSSSSASDGSRGLCAVGYGSGRVQLVCVAGLRLLQERRVHVAGVCCLEFGPGATLLSASVDGEVRLHAAAIGQLLLSLIHI